MLSQYGSTDGRPPGEVWMETGRPVFDRREVTPHSLFVGNFVADYQELFFQQMAGWIAEGRIIYTEDVWPDLERAPEAFSAMLSGGNFGKTLVAVSEDPTLAESARRGAPDRFRTRRHTRS
jgi:NADPH-dependent curcumin reductase CurA